MNKTFRDRIRVTRGGKFVARGAGQDHFNAKERRVRQLAKKRSVRIVLPRKVLSHYAS
jgi:ribosomal protein L35